MSGKPPLEGKKVLDFSMFTPGPFASQILADLGATVLKIERPGVGDLERVSVPAYFRAYNRGKASLVLDLRSEADQAVANELVKEATIVLDGFRPGVMDRLKLGFADLSALQPRLIYVSLNGLGSWGPHAQDRGHDSEYMARIGGLGVTPRPGGVPMYDLPVPISDYAAGMYAVIGILSTLLDPDHSAVHLETPVMAAGLAWMFPRLVMELEDGNGPSAGRQSAGVGCFRTRDERYVTVTAVEDHVFADQARLLGCPELIEDPAYRTFGDRRAHAAEINARIAETVAKLDRDACVKTMEKAGVPCAPVNTAAEALQDPQVAALEMVHRAPSLHCDTPIWGLNLRRHVAPPLLNQHGPAIRARGWSALTGQ